MSNALLHDGFNPCSSIVLIVDDYNDQTQVTLRKWVKELWLKYILSHTFTPRYHESFPNQVGVRTISAKKTKKGIKKKLLWSLWTPHIEM